MSRGIPNRRGTAMEPDPAIVREPGEPYTAAPLAETGLRHMFASLRYRDYRLLWIGQLSWYTSLVVDNLARNWLV